MSKKAKDRIRRCIETRDTRLNLINCEISNLKKEIPEVFDCVHLKELILSSNNISELGPLASLTNLTTLRLSSNKISELGTLASLSNLTGLELSSNQVSELEPLKSLTNLIWLDLSSNNISELGPLASLTNLTTLRLSSNKISELGTLASLSNLTELELSSNQVSELEPLKSLTNLTWLDLSSNNISELGPLSPLANLTWLELSSNQVSELGPLESLTNLTRLMLSSNKIIELGPLAGLTNLTKLMLSSNQISKLEALSSLTNMIMLMLSSNQISKLEALTNLTNLKGLMLSSNQISELGVFASLTNLAWLDLSSNNITELGSVACLTNLITLSLSSNKISELEALVKLKNLKTLRLSNNLISNYKPFLSIENYRSGKLSDLQIKDNLNPQPNGIVSQGYEALKKYYDTLDVEGRIQNDQLKVILLGNSTVGKTSLVRYWGKKEFSRQQTTTHGIATEMELPLTLDSSDETFRVIVWDFGGQDYYHATHRLFITADSTYILVCNSALENKPDQELTTEYIEMDGKVKAVQIPVQHFPYRYWLQTLAFLTKSGKIDDLKSQYQDKSKPPRLFLVENKCGTYESKKRMSLEEGLDGTLPFDVIDDGFYHLDIQEAYRFKNLIDTGRRARIFSDAYEEFEESLIKTLQIQISENRDEIHRNYPKIRDILAQLADYKKNTVVSPELNLVLAQQKIAPIKQYEKLPVWITYDQYQDLVRKNSRSEEPDYNSLHIYLQNLCGRILHFRDIPALTDIVFIDPNWLHGTIYKVLSQQVLGKKGEFTLEEADAVIDGNILEAAKFMDVMMAFELVFEIPHQSPRRFVAPQYLPVACPLLPPQLKKYREQFHQLSLTLQFPYYLPPSLISRIISLKGDLIKAQNEPLWRNGLIYTEHGLSIFLLCTPNARKIEIYLSPANKTIHRKILRDFMIFMEKKFSDEIEDVLLSLPDPKVPGTAKWKHLYRAKKENKTGAKDYDDPTGYRMVNSQDFAFLFEEFERQPINVFVCYAHDDHAEMVRFVEPLKKELASYQAQDKGTIKIAPFTDLQLTPGMQWDEELKAKIKENDILICLLSPSFFGSTYIHENEYGHKMREIAAGQSNSLIAPVYLKSCYVSAGNPIGTLQFFKPLASDFHLENTPDFSFSNLISHAGGSYVGNYVTAFVRSIAGNIEEIWGRK